MPVYPGVFDLSRLIAFGFVRFAFRSIYCGRFTVVTDIAAIIRNRTHTMFHTAAAENEKVKYTKGHERQPKERRFVAVN